MLLNYKIKNGIYILVRDNSGRIPPIGGKRSCLVEDKVYEKDPDIKELKITVSFHVLVKP